MSGTPVMRPLWLEFPGDPLTFNISDTFMIGNGLLVRGIFEEVFHLSFDLSLSLYILETINFTILLDGRREKNL